MSLAQSFLDQFIERRLISPVCVALQGALGGDLDDIDFIQQAEALQERTVGQVCGKVAIAFLQVGAHDIAAQGLAAVSLIVHKGGGAHLLPRAQISEPLLAGSSDELLFQAGEEDLIEAEEFVAEFAIIDTALNGGQRGSERLLEGNNGVNHDARV